MRTTHRPVSPALAPIGEPRDPLRAPEGTPAPPTSAPRPAPAVVAAMRLLHRSSAAPNGFISAAERAYLEHRRGSGE